MPIHIVTVQSRDVAMLTDFLRLIKFRELSSTNLRELPVTFAWGYMGAHRQKYALHRLLKVIR